MNEQSLFGSLSLVKLHKQTQTLHSFPCKLSAPPSGDTLKLHHFYKNASNYKTLGSKLNIHYICKNGRISKKGCFEDNKFHKSSGIYNIFVCVNNTGSSFQRNVEFCHW